MKKYLYFLILFTLIATSVLAYKQDGLNFLLAQLTPTFEIPTIVDVTPPAVSGVAVDYNNCAPTAILTATVTDTESGVKSVVAKINGNSYTMKNDGNYPDLSATDNIYSVGVPVVSYASGSYAISITAEDKSFNSYTYTNASWTFTPLDCGAPEVKDVVFNFVCSTSVLTVSATITDDTGVGSGTVIIQDAYPTGNIMGAGTMTRQGTTSTYTITVNDIWKYTDATYYFYISATDTSGNSKTYSNILWKFDKLASCNDSPSDPDTTPPTISGNVVYDGATNKATTNGTITDASGIRNAMVIYKNFAGEIIYTGLMTHGSGSAYTHILDMANYPSGTYKVYISATDNKGNNGVYGPMPFTTAYAIDSFTVTPSSVISGTTFGTSFTLSAHMLGSAAKIQGEGLTFTDDTDPSVVIGTATVGADGTATISNYKIKTSIKGAHTLRVTHEANSTKNIPYSYLTTPLNVTDVPICSTVNGDTLCIYISTIENSAQLYNFTITAAGVTYTQAQYASGTYPSVGSALLSFRSGVIKAGTSAVADRATFSVNLADTRLCDEKYPLEQCTNAFPLEGETVVFRDETDDVDLGSGITNSSGVATLTLNPPTSQNVGKHTIRVVYNGSIEKKYAPSYKENFLNEQINACSYANGATSGERICVFMGFLNSDTMTTFTISPTTAIAGKNTGTVKPGTLVTFTATLSNSGTPVVGEAVSFIDNTQEYTIAWVANSSLGVSRPGCEENAKVRYLDIRQNVVLGTAVTNSSGVATLTYRFPYAVYMPYVYNSITYDSIRARLLPQSQGTHDIMAVYAGSTTKTLGASWIKSSLSLSVPGTCIWFPNTFDNTSLQESWYRCALDADNLGTGGYKSNYFCSAISQKNP